MSDTTTTTDVDLRERFLPRLAAGNTTTVVIPADTHIEPVDWQTITSTECLNGDPSLPFEISYPVFDPSMFPAHVQDRIPDPDYFFVDHDNLLFGIISDLMRGDSPVVWGEAGIGKSVAFEKVAALMQVPFLRIHLNEFTDPEVFTGHYELVAGETTWVHSPAVELLGLPSLQVYEEWNSASEGCRFWSRPLLDGYNRVTLDGHEGETYLRHQWAFIGSTGNPHYSSRNFGVVPLSEPDNDRLSHHVVDWPKPSVEFEILWRLRSDQGLPITGAQIVNAIAVWNHMRSRIDTGEITAGGSTRSLKRFVGNLGTASPESAFARCFRRVAPKEYATLATSLATQKLTPTATAHAFTYDQLTAAQKALVMGKKKPAKTGVTYTLA